MNDWLFWSKLSRKLSRKLDEPSTQKYIQSILDKSIYIVYSKTCGGRYENNGSKVGE